ncbi:tetratricopeptide repeat protein [Marinibacterium sp. SX1]|uniref:tetratricopeptide repeat protein n=1 Tax=Marinibacterium sp. SX1 TaxID=3388424 RepID=UPI003D179CDB
MPQQQKPTIAEQADAAQAHLMRHEYPAALAVIDTALADAPDHPRLVTQKITILRRMGRNDAALAFADTLPDALRTGPVLHLLVGLLSDLGQLDAAQALVERAQAPTRATPAYRLAAVRLLRRREGRAAAVELCRTLRAPDNLLGLVREEGEMLFALGRSDEALALLLPTLDTRPNPSILLLVLRHHVDRGQFAAARDLLTRHGPLIAAMPWRPYFDARLAEAEADLARALAIAAEGVARFPDHMQLQALHWRLLLADGQREAAIAAAAACAEARPDTLGTQIQAVQFLNRLGAEEPADAALARCLRLDPDNLTVILARAEALMARKDAQGVRDLLDALPDTLRGREAIQIRIAQAEAVTDALPRAIERLNTLAHGPGDSANLRLTLAQFCVRLGRLEEAQAQLDTLDPAPDDRFARVRRHLVRAQILFESGQPGAALDAVMEAIALAPENEGAWNFRTRYALLLGRIDEAWDSHVEATRLGHANTPRGNRQAKPNASLPGQLVNEYRLQTHGEDLSACAGDAPQDAAMRHFRSRVEVLPDATPLAICLFSAMFRAGRLPDRATATARPDAGDEGIPRKLFQYWDKSQPPASVERLFQLNAARNPDFDYRRLDHKAAVTFLRDKGELAVLRAFLLAPHPAAQSDLLRLALLWHEGGVYLDADDLCLGPLSDMLVPGLRLAGVLEDWMSVGNNFIAVRPRDPIIRAALDDAAAAFMVTMGESIWLATGPGAMTRAMARHGLDDDGRLAPGIWLQTLPALRAHIAPHIVLSYKGTADHWIEQSRSRPGATPPARRSQR